MRPSLTESEYLEAKAHNKPSLLLFAVGLVELACYSRKRKKT
jgi:hypothetical protein